MFKQIVSKIFSNVRLLKCINDKIFFCTKSEVYVFVNSFVRVFVDSRGNVCDDFCIADFGFHEGILYVIVGDCVYTSVLFSKNSSNSNDIIFNEENNDLSYNFRNDTKHNMREKIIDNTKIDNSDSDIEDFDSNSNTVDNICDKKGLSKCSIFYKINKIPHTTMLNSNNENIKCILDNQNISNTNLFEHNEYFDLQNNSNIKNINFYNLSDSKEYTTNCSDFLDRSSKYHPDEKNDSCRTTNCQKINFLSNLEDGFKDITPKKRKEVSNLINANKNIKNVNFDTNETLKNSKNRKINIDNSDYSEKPRPLINLKIIMNEDIIKKSDKKYIYNIKKIKKSQNSCKLEQYYKNSIPLKLNINSQYLTKTILAEFLSYNKFSKITNIQSALILENDITYLVIKNNEYKLIDKAKYQGKQKLISENYMLLYRQNELNVYNTHQKNICFSIKIDVDHLFTTDNNIFYLKSGTKIYEFNIEDV
ncbi:hypothetical protein EDEG_03500 [Edhazardia aedis USNM 41457]|uniref:Uncharacterized protein n=1 Tax=Edhazardia aedis (strain USNM 41457) TaxID=1003232 RepID=J9DHI7_EDHAE|nr:hypothetical protein EDEG_03500 [Edhazardia aedis USNM 41457]|eukprot:EJW02050.1 hypothetical protein EDEG_03500 [Edhazardia aedis USNM 41457]